LYISQDIKELVLERAGYSCEYCRLPVEYFVFPAHIDHIIASQHGGKTTLENLCVACPPCNLQKGPNIATLHADDPTRVIPLFNPRTDVWHEHFQLIETGHIRGRTVCGRATETLLKLNSSRRLTLRLLLIRKGWKP
jgi:5-methylcytosine-specific restriction endonuclease McrA